MTRYLTGCVSFALAACAWAALPIGAPITAPPLPALAPAHGAVQFARDFERSASDCGFFEQSKVPGRATLVPVARTGQWGVRLHTEPGGGVVMDLHHDGSGGNANFHFNSAPTGLRLHGFGGDSRDRSNTASSSGRS